MNGELVPVGQCNCSERSQVQLVVEDFMRAAGQKVRAIPEMPSEDERFLRAKLALEETIEEINALGFDIECSRDDGVICSTDDVLLLNIRKPDMVGIADGAIDNIVIRMGTLSACGVSDQGMMRRVLEANQRKFDGGHAREDGKWVKPDDWEPPNILEELILQGYKPEE